MMDQPFINNKSRTYYSRKILRIPGYDYANEGYYFVTTCAHDRECIFGEIANDGMRLNGAGKIVEDMWRELPARFLNIKLGEFVVMSNHIHGIIMIMDPMRGVGAAAQWAMDDENPDRKRRLQ